MIKKTSIDSLNQWLFIRRPIKNITWSENALIPVTLPDIQELKREIIQCIESAENCLKICSFIITDEDIINSLLEKLKTSDVAVFILTQLDKTKFSSSFLTDEEIDENPSQIHLDAISLLYDRGAHIRASDSVHAKFLIVDDKKTLLTSANLTTPSLTSNPESGVFLTGSTSQDASKVFDLVFRYGTTYNRFVSAGGGKRYVMQTTRELNKDWLPSSKNNFLFTLNDLNKSIYEELVQVIDDAEDEIILSTYCVVSLGNLPELIDSIKNAINRGVSIHVFCRGMNYRSDHLHGCSILAEMGCKIYGDLLNHSKGLSNGSKTIIFTANLDGRHGLHNGFEVGAHLTPEKGAVLKNFMEWQINTAPYHFKKNPNRKEAFETYDWYCRTRNIPIPEAYSTLYIRANGLNKSERELLEDHVFYGIYKGKDLLAIELDGKFFSTHSVVNVVYIKPTNTRYYHSERYLIRYSEIIIEYE